MNWFQRLDAAVHTFDGAASMMEAIRNLAEMSTMVAEVIVQKKDEIAALCRRYRVRTLWVFGSAVTDAVDPETSDIDFLVDLGEYDDIVHRRFFDFMDALESLFQRSVDLLTIRSLDNPYFREELEETRVLVYGSPDAEVAA